MFLPKFTLRQTLVWVLVAGVVSIVLAAAWQGKESNGQPRHRRFSWQGKEWAIGQTAALVAATAVAFLAALAYWIFFLFGNLLTQRTKRKPATNGRTEILSGETKP